MLVITSYCSKVLKNFKFSTIDVGAFLVVLLLKLAFSIYPTFDENALVVTNMSIGDCKWYMLEDFSIKTIKVCIIRHCNCKKIYSCATIASYVYDATVAQWYS